MQYLLTQQELDELKKSDSNKLNTAMSEWFHSLEKNLRNEFGTELGHFNGSFSLLNRIRKCIPPEPKI